MKKWYSRQYKNHSVQKVLENEWNDFSTVKLSNNEVNSPKLNSHD